MADRHTVTFELEVDVPRDLAGEDPSEEDLADAAREMLYSAPGFDGISEDVIRQLTVADTEATSR